MDLKHICQQMKTIAMISCSTTVLKIILILVKRFFFFIHIGLILYYGTASLVLNSEISRKASELFSQK